ncbi:MAG: Mu transposase domain-containing protein [Eubacteriales bacterium]
MLELMPNYDTARTCELRVNKYSTVSIDESKYSVPDNLVGKFVFVKIYPENINIYHKGKLVSKHERNYGNHTWNINIEHYINTIKKKPGSRAKCYTRTSEADYNRMVTMSFLALDIHTYSQELVCLLQKQYSNQNLYHSYTY